MALSTERHFRLVKMPNSLGRKRSHLHLIHFLKIPFWPHSNSTFFWFFRYHGSLTAPPCTENVVWTVFQRPISMTLRQLNKFRQIYKPPDKRTRFMLTKLLKDNFRSVVPLGPDRIIYANNSFSHYLSNDFTACMTILLIAFYIAV